MKYIIDTDIGDDVDDMYAIFFAELLNLEIIGITTVFRNSVQRAKMTKYLLQCTKLKRTPVYAGLDKPLIQPLEDLGSTFNYEYIDGVYQLPQYLNEMDSQTVPKKDAVDFLIESAEKFGNDLTVLAIGPVTNLAAAIIKAPDSMKKLKEIRVLCGAYTYDVPEWNIVCDPEAMRIVVKSGINVKVMGIDVTLKLPLSDEQVERLMNLSGRVECIPKMMKKWYNLFNFERPIMHDALLMASVADENVVKFYDKNVLICLEGADRGKSKIIDEPSKLSSNIEVGLEVDVGLFFSYFNRVFDYLEKVQ